MRFIQTAINRVVGAQDRECLLDTLPKLAQAKSKEALLEIWIAEIRVNAQYAFDQFIHTCQGKYP